MAQPKVAGTQRASRTHRAPELNRYAPAPAPRTAGDEGMNLNYSQRVQLRAVFNKQITYAHLITRYTNCRLLGHRAFNYNLVRKDKRRGLDL